MKTIQSMIIAGVMMGFGMPLSAQAESALAWLPFGIEPGKPLPDKAKRTLYYDEDSEKYRLDGKFYIHYKKGVVNNFYIGLKEGGSWDYSVPKRWARLGMRLCTKNQRGASLDDMKAMAKKEGGKYFEVDSSNQFYDVLSFEIAGKYLYSLYFYVRDLSYEGLAPYCKGGMVSINVGEPMGEEY